MTWAESVLAIRMAYDGRAVTSGTQRTASDIEKLSKRGVQAFRLLAAGGFAVAAKDLFMLGVQANAWERKTATVFGSAAGNVRKWSDEWNERLGVSDERLAGLVAGVGDLLVPLGLARDEAARMSTDVVRLSAALSEWSGGTITAADAQQRLIRAMLGEREGLIPLGVKISELDVQARLAAKGLDGLTGEALALAKAQVTLELVTGRSSDAITAFEGGGDDAAVAAREFAAAFDDLRVAAADVVVGLTPLVSLLAGIVSTTTKLPGLLEGAAVGFGVLLAGAKLGIAHIVGGPEALAAAVLYASTRNEKHSDLLLRRLAESRRDQADVVLRQTTPVVAAPQRQRRNNFETSRWQGLADHYEAQVALAAAEAARSQEVRAAQDAFAASLAGGFSDALKRHKGALEPALRDLLAAADVQRAVNSQLEAMAQLGLGAFAEGLTGSPAEISAALTTLLGAGLDKQLELALSLGNSFAAEIIRGLITGRDRLQGLADWWQTAGEIARAAYIGGFGVPVLPTGVPGGVPVVPSTGTGRRYSPDGSGTTVVVNVAGSVTTERDLVETVRRGLIDAGDRGS